MLVLAGVELKPAQEVWDSWWYTVVWDHTGLIMKYLGEGQQVGEREGLRWLWEGQVWEERDEGMRCLLIISRPLVSTLVWPCTTPDQHNVSCIFKLYFNYFPE